jgi:hypothetical protein
MKEHEKKCKRKIKETQPSVEKKEKMCKRYKYKELTDEEDEFYYPLE